MPGYNYTDSSVGRDHILLGIKNVHLHVLLQIMLAIENRCALDSIEESFQNHSKVREEFANVGCLMSLHSQHLEMSFFSLHNTWKCHSSAYKLSFEVKIPLQLMCDIID